MLFAHDYNSNRVHINETCSNQEYYCQFCGAKLITKKGNIRQHHFAHKTRQCSDTWVGHPLHHYDTSPWHNDWQSLFPRENQEIRIELGSTKHRADVMIDKTVIEFQHSIISAQAFDERNNFYLNIGNKIIWLFDLSDLLESEQLSYEQAEDGLVFYWKNPRKTFNRYDIESSSIEVFFQVKKDDSSIVKAVEISRRGFEDFKTTDFITKEDFLDYVGMKNGKCLPPCIETEETYLEFKKKYNIQLNKQQERAMLAVEGSVLLLAVPGSGKTTVLVSRLGHMVINKKIPPENLLAITYTTQAADEMRTRFASQFGQQIADSIDFRTINSFCSQIYRNYCFQTQ